MNITPVIEKYFNIIPIYCSPNPPRRQVVNPFHDDQLTSNYVPHRIRRKVVGSLDGDQSIATIPVAIGGARRVIGTWCC